MPTLDLRREWLETVRRLIVLYTPGADVFAFGSRVNGTSHEGSDLDLVARNSEDPTKPIPGIPALRQALSESDLPILVDVLDWASIPETFREEINNATILPVYRQER